MSNFDGSSLHWMNIMLGQTYTSLAALFSSGYNSIILSTFDMTRMDNWKTLVGPRASLEQSGCFREGVNVGTDTNSWYYPYTVRARLGFLANEDSSSCSSPDSAIGFGVLAPNYQGWCGLPSGRISLPAGNLAGCGSNGIFSLPLFGYIMGA